MYTHTELLICPCDTLGYTHIPQANCKTQDSDPKAQCGSAREGVADHVAVGARGVAVTLQQRSQCLDQGVFRVYFRVSLSLWVFIATAVLLQGKQCMSHRQGASGYLEGERDAVVREVVGFTRLG